MTPPSRRSFSPPTTRVVPSGIPRPRSTQGPDRTLCSRYLFFGLLGRQRVVVLYESGIELPSDLAGLIYIPLDPAGAWRWELLKEIEAAGIEVDRTRIL